ncbi:hypothetical protein LFM09_17915 [Lentzea alba]|uniref:hypothetical protein n=1 Tax=Lentzea alba TaxID=2714351 RepID=UPI0039BFFCC1
MLPAVQQSLALESETDPSLTRPYPLDTLGAETQRMIGYWLARSQRNAGVRKPVLAVVTQTVVDAADPAFAAPTEFIGPIYDRAPEPLRLVEQESVEQLVSGGTIVVCAGGGGAPSSTTGSSTASRRSWTRTSPRPSSRSR